VPVSAVTGSGLDALRAALGAALAGSRPAEDALVTDARHAEAIRSGVEAMERAASALSSGLSEELAIEDLREAQASLAEIVGELAHDALYDRIFSTFCIGK
jgi:tRNA modification GTPase